MVRSGRSGSSAAPTIQATSCSWFSAVGTVSPTPRPRRSTTARSATAMTWSMLWEMRITATPSSEAADQVEHPRGLAQAERGGGLVEDDELGREGDRARHGDRLALSARHQRDRCSRSGRATWSRSRVGACARPSRGAAGSRRPRGSHVGPRARGRRRSWPPGRDCRTARGPGRPSRRRARGPPSRRRRDVRSPSRMIAPASRRCTPLIALISVDLPAPLSPSSASTSPRATSSDTPSSATTAPKRLVASRTCSTGARRRSWRARRLHAAEPAFEMATQHVELDRRRR